ncbi:MAG: hypothetical protein HY236_09575 [Acidobacteria bacterium]|nr:hypothetical protein [Acidobacteriota bacterium]
MSRYRIHYLKESQRSHVRNAPPVPGPVRLKMKDYQPGGTIEAATPYAAWKQLRKQEGETCPIQVGDALETDTGALLVCRYVGFEPAEWFVPEPPPAAPAPQAGSQTVPPAATQGQAPPASG